MIKKIDCTIQGTTPLLMHRFPLVEIEAHAKKTPEEQAEIAAYRIPETKELYMPCTNLQRCFVRGANYVKGKGRGSLMKPTAACLMVSPEYVLFGTKHYTIDSRAVVIAATKGRIVRHRPRLDSWKLSFGIEFDDALLSMKELRMIVDNGGLRCGVGDFRPERGGYFGRFVVINWKD